MPYTTGVLSNYLENKIFEYIFLGRTFEPATLYAALYTTPITDSDTGTELTIGSNGYQRAQVTNGFTVDIAGNIIYNDGTITFPEATGNWGTITHLGIRSGTIAGYLYAYFTFETPLVITSGEQILIPEGYLWTWAYASNPTYYGAWSEIAYCYIMDWVLNGLFPNFNSLKMALGRNATFSGGFLTSWIECSGDGYAPKSVHSINYWIDEDDYHTNALPVEFTTSAGSDWGLIDTVVFTTIDPVTGLDIPVLSGKLTVPITVYEGDALTFVPGMVKVYIQ